MPQFFFDVFWDKAIELEAHLSKHEYFSKGYLPGLADSLMFEIFINEFPPRTSYPCIYYWYINIKQFSLHAIRSWTSKSDQDEYFLLILKNYVRWKEAVEKQKLVSIKLIDFQYHSFRKLPIKSEYTINLQFIPDENILAKRLGPKIQKNQNNQQKSVNDKTWRFPKGNSKLQLQRSSKQIQNIKSTGRSTRKIRNCQQAKKKIAEKIKIRRPSAFLGF